MDKIIIIQLVAGILIGGAIGALLGYVGKCSTGTCPLTANPMRGSLYGAFLGVLLATTFGGTQRNALAVAGAAAHIESVEDFQMKVLDSEQPVVVDFYSKSCPPCIQLAPTINKLAEDYADKAVVVKVDVRKLPELAQQYSIRGTPTVVFLQHGEEVKRTIGLDQESTYKQQLDTMLDT